MSPVALSSAVRAVGILCFFAGLFFLAQAYTIAFHGMWLDCFEGDGCSMRPYGEPTLPSALYGTFLAIGAGITFYVGTRALRWPQRR